MRKMINKEIGVSLIALTLVVVSLFNATNVYADLYKHNDKEGKGLRVIIDLVKEDVRDHVELTVN
jgi:methyl coenzyme M reductase beta subunit